ncbi:MAG: hypothetical protein ACRD3G_01180 [Vicinamibacterales bacterium]
MKTNVATLTVVSILLGFGTPRPAGATSIDFLESVDIVSQFGETTGGPGETVAIYYAQTFKVPIDATAGILTFLLTTPTEFTGPDDTEFAVLVTDTDASGHPSTVLFETPVLTFPFGASATYFDIDLQGLALASDVTYAWILDSVIATDGSIGWSSVGLSVSPYSGGTFLTASTQTFPVLVGTREDHFTGGVLGLDGWVAVDHDLAFRLTYTPVVAVPEPLSLLLVMTAIGVRAAGHARRRYDRT